MKTTAPAHAKKGGSYGSGSTTLGIGLYLFSLYDLIIGLMLKLGLLPGADRCSGGREAERLSEEDR